MNQTTMIAILAALALALAAADAVLLHGLADRQASVEKQEAAQTGEIAMGVAKLQQLAVSLAAVEKQATPVTALAADVEAQKAQIAALVAEFPTLEKIGQMEESLGVKLDGYQASVRAYNGIVQDLGKRTANLENTLTGSVFLIFPNVGYVRLDVALLALLLVGISATTVGILWLRKSREGPGQQPLGVGNKT